MDRKEKTVMLVLLLIFVGCTLAPLVWHLTRSCEDAVPSEYGCSHDDHAFRVEGVTAVCRCRE